MIVVFFIAIILSNYLQLKKKINLTALALSRIAAKESASTTEKWISLICMKPPIENENDDEKDVRFSQSEKCWKLII